MKFVASILASQLPKGIQRKVRDKVRDDADDIEGADGRGLIKTIKLELTERGYPLDLGNKDFERIKKFAMLSEATEPPHGHHSTNDLVKFIFTHG